jgi:hypothetical protein
MRPEILDVVVKYARLRSGRPVLCGAANKIIYDDEESAESARRELAEVGGQSQRAYSCDRKRHSHWHLTSEFTPDGPC